MKRSRFSESQIFKILEEGKTVPIPELCRQYGISTAAYYKWRSKYGGMDVSMISRVKELEAENQRLKKMYAESKMDAEILREVLAKKW
jgi:putative transposase